MLKNYKNVIKNQSYRCKILIIRVLYERNYSEDIRLNHRADIVFV